MIRGFITCGSILNEENFLLILKQKVIKDFAERVDALICNYGIDRGSMEMYDKFDKLGTITLEYDDENAFIDGLQIEVSECVDAIVALSDGILDNDKVRQFFGRGEFPFAMTKYRIDGENVLFGYYITR